MQIFFFLQIEEAKKKKLFHLIFVINRLSYLFWMSKMERVCLILKQMKCMIWLISFVENVVSLSRGEERFEYHRYFLDIFITTIKINFSVRTPRSLLLIINATSFLLHSHRKMNLCFGNISSNDENSFSYFNWNWFSNLRKSN